LNAWKPLRTNGASEPRYSLRTSNSGYALDTLYTLNALRSLIDERDIESRRMASLVIFLAVEEDISRCGI
jgi:hypothetical protein